jgi:glutamine amidotransferase
MKITIIKYNAGNIQSVLFALQRLGVEALVTDDPGMIRSSDKVIFPGVGEASSAMHYLKEREMDLLIRSLTQPVLGICLGMQLLCEHSAENNTDCLNIIPVDVKKFPAGGELKAPQIGWNNIYDLRSPLFEGITENSFIYNVHGYYAEQSQYTIATCNYGMEYAAAIAKDNFFGVQFHAEKSSLCGERILGNFLKIK